MFTPLAPFAMFFLLPCDSIGIRVPQFHPSQAVYYVSPGNVNFTLCFWWYYCDCISFYNDCGSSAAAISQPEPAASHQPASSQPAASRQPWVCRGCAAGVPRMRRFCISGGPAPAPARPQDPAQLSHQMWKVTIIAETSLNFQSNVDHGSIIGRCEKWWLYLGRPWNSNQILTAGDVKSNDYNWDVLDFPIRYLSQMMWKVMVIAETSLRFQPHGFHRGFEKSWLWLRRPLFPNHLVSMEDVKSSDSGWDVQHFLLTALT